MDPQRRTVGTLALIGALMGCASPPSVYPYFAPLPPANRLEGPAPTQIAFVAGCEGTELVFGDDAFFFVCATPAGDDTRIVRVDRKTHAVISDAAIKPVQELTLGATSVFFTNRREVRRMPRTGGASTKVIDLPRESDRIELQGDTLWLAGGPSDARGIHRLVDGKLERVYAAETPWFLHVSGEDVVWADHVTKTGPPMGTLVRLGNVRGDAPRTLTVARGSFPIFVAGGYVYAKDWAFPLREGLPFEYGGAFSHVIGTDERFIYYHAYDGTWGVRPKNGIRRSRHADPVSMPFADERTRAASFASDGHEGCWIGHADHGTYLWCAPA